jgi:peptidoglycan-associated lipoprotein
MKDARYLVIVGLLLILPALVCGGCSRKAAKVEQQEVVAEVPPQRVEPAGEPAVSVPAGIPEEALEELPPVAAREKVFLETSPLEEIYFDYDRSAIREDAAKILTRSAAWLKDHPAVEVMIEGHCDERGTVEYNLALGERRAASTRAYLVRLGIDPNRLFTISYGEERPVDPRHNEEAWAKNRRAHFLITSGEKY